jgi:hypothetical protein
MILSIVQTGISAYNYVSYGNCNGPDESGFCIFDPLGSNQEHVSVCTPDGVLPVVCPPGVSTEECAAMKLPIGFDVLDNPKTGSSSAKVTIVEFGCFACPNTGEQAPAVKKLIEHYGADIQFVYVDFPLEHHAFAREASLASYCVREQDKLKYWQYHFTIFNNQEELSNDSLRSWAAELGLDMDSYDTCLQDPLTSSAIDADIALAHRVGVYGTPTFFIANESLVGVKSYKFLKTKIDAALDANN